MPRQLRSLGEGMAESPQASEVDFEVAGKFEIKLPGTLEIAAFEISCPDEFLMRRLSGLYHVELPVSELHLFNGASLSQE